MDDQQVVSIAASDIVAGCSDRTVFDPIALAELAENIRAARRLIQPLTVRPIAGPVKYQIVAGERRYRACSQLLGWTEIPCIVADLSDEDAAAIMLAENTSRADIDLIDEARAYQVRIERFGWTVEDCARKGGVSVSRVQRRLKLLKLREDLQGLIRSGNLPIGYAEILADYDLDTNRQTLAVARFRECPHPTMGWFRTMLSALLEEQAQNTLLPDMDLFLAPLSADGDAPMPTWPAGAQPAVTLDEPPHPTTTQPPAPAPGATAAEVLMQHAEFWSAAADRWLRLGRHTLRKECEAAAAALRASLNFVS